jgi:DNA-binding NtrC family response regulator
MASNREPTDLKSGRAAREKSGASAILIVEDEVSVRKLVTRFLTISGYQVLAADGPCAALELWAAHHDEVSLLLTDVIMPGALSGRALAMRLQAERPALKVLYTSGYSAESLADDGTLDDEIHFLQKPYRPEQLLETVRAVLAGEVPSNQNQKNQNRNRYVETTAC